MPPPAPLATIFSDQFVELFLLRSKKLAAPSFFFVKIIDNPTAMILTQSSLRGTQCVAALRRALLSQITFGSLLGRPGRSLVVSKAGQPKTGEWFSSLFCSLTSGFEGRETQTAGSWRILSSEIWVRDLK
jgi:hypothetical protein